MVRVSPTSPTMSSFLLVIPVPCYACTTRLQNHRLSKKLGVLNEDGVYAGLEIRIRGSKYFHSRVDKVWRFLEDDD